MNLQISKWGNSLAVRIPAEYARQLSVKEGDQFEGHVGIDGTLNLRPIGWNRRLFAQELMVNSAGLPMGASVINDLREQARY
jgi:antitoxin MazE